MGLPDLISTGLAHLDAVINGLRKGDNVVWQVDRIEDYEDFVASFTAQALGDKRRVVYIHFSDRVVISDERIQVYHLNAFRGFESFSTRLHQIIKEEGRGVFYIFDCLSELLSAWATDLMIGNFFAVTCPYLFELDTIAYFALLRGRHSHKSIARIRDTTQLLLDLYSYGDDICLHPLKVWNRYSSTMFLPHVRQGEEFVPLTSSADAAQLFTQVCERGLQSGVRRLDHWDQLFLDAEDLLAQDRNTAAVKKAVKRFCGIMLGRDDRINRLARKYFELRDLLEIKSRLIGTGFIGGKSVGMLLARAMLLRDTDEDWRKYLEPHDSYYVGSDVFYTFIVHNGWWKLFMAQRTKEGYFEAAQELRGKMLSGQFPEEIREQLYGIIEYFGQSPIIVRSSSLLEDGYGNAFAGKYESIFCVNQGSPEERYAQFEDAIRRIYASAMSEDALAYRLQRGLSEQDEQMALLVQRVSGAYHQRYFFPFVAGVGVSYNTFVWQSKMDPRAGMLRLVFGLGTRAVNRVEGDYPRIAALDMPLLRPHGSVKDIRRFSQHEADVLDIGKNELMTVAISEVASEGKDVDLGRIGIRDIEAEGVLRELGRESKELWLITFDALLSDADFVDRIRRMLKTLEKIYRYPVDVEFTINFSKKGAYRINLLQCRPLQTKGRQKRRVKILAHLDPECILFKTRGNFLGGSIEQRIDLVVVVDSEQYGALPQTDKYGVARLIGAINKRVSDRQDCAVLLVGPGRWGTTTPSLGVPVSFSEINNISVLVEVAFAQGNLMPELSYGTHFFHDLVETDIFYVALFPEEEGSAGFNRNIFAGFPNELHALAPDYARYAQAVAVYDVSDMNMRIAADVVSQQAVCYSERPAFGS